MAKEVAIWVGLVTVAVLLAIVGGKRSASAGRTPEVAGHVAVGFDVLASFDYVTPPVGERGPTGQLPEDVLALDQTSVLVRGFVLPLESDQGEVFRFYLARYPLGCCFGRPVAANELVLVDLVDPVPYRPHRPLWLRGRLEVEERFDAAGYLESVYRLEDGALVRMEERATAHEAAASRSGPLPAGAGTDASEPPRPIRGQERAAPKGSGSPRG